MLAMPNGLYTAKEELRVHEGLWDSERDMDKATLMERPILPLVEGFLELQRGGAERLARLCFFVSRRVLPAWKLYCDGDRPLRAIEALGRYLEDGIPPADAPELQLPATPSFRGSNIVDCRECDTASAAKAAASALAFALGGNAADAMECLSHAAAAMDQSPLGAREDFVRWLVDVAIEYAWQNREMPVAKQNAFRNFDPNSIVPEA